MVDADNAPDAVKGHVTNVVCRLGNANVLTVLGTKTVSVEEMDRAPFVSKKPDLSPIIGR